MRVALNIEPNRLIEYLHSLVDSSAKVSADSRQIRSGDIFFAYPVGHGNALRDGRQYIDAALSNGAAVVVFDPADFGAQYLDHPHCVAVENLAANAGDLCAQWYGYPSKQLQIIGVTGTNGKTSISQWLASALDGVDHRTAVLGTLGTGFVGNLVQTGYTTPDAPRLQTQLQELLEAGAKQVVMEASSHALEQGRIAGIEFNCAVFTNLTQDHLDYHGNMANYADAKAKLFQMAGLEHAVINFDDAFGRELAMQLLAKGAVKVWAYALSKAALSGFEKFGDRLQRVYVNDCVLNGVGYDTEFIHEGVSLNAIHIPVVGEFNLSNALAVWAVLLTQGLSADEASKRVTKLRPVPGRMELISLGNSAKSDGLMVIVDYAHTPDALQKTLQAIRPIADQRHGKIWCVFGCGGDRDNGKRAQMGAVAEKLAHHIIITSDNPRSEDPQDIMNMIKAGTSDQAQNIQMIADRAAAIMAAVRHADACDIVLVAGKGHETSQEINGKKFDFSDQEHILLAAGGVV
ncbi:UDP-N-acetylmuramoyl-L-alanyl-D-glutamate--2,6-diaminopimelate ligase [Polynucleobacter sp. AP-Latsch-80-C2]|jgi:UDP-N-acetylmuramoyl-L-alanyl-D-glutamate--2,6-diaminopimelate ligase|uniref:UDP-N-acetylmuramoyl-L-alanyl-D-glutamate--2, 6-diaminopimelate ligase n=1 Tax=Polynucleobacter sp. AP-Latsch-80-C2 TaxID=2576931 RepID=UPI001C0B639E|nr:UDP-N-acetylmuramoyl-L-alanyl-D-glutamate--2,6-diaminopimelate ligase [Polynucleobacter sp. AP-Latsch-80-C2]MBU3623360.1 UDP-N-acetylmuramoyl-L-alanyl-D-glutamate--2,6-diaminopimelate ligase [Polynucleobacter sp. AP-Latsch-80-C2]